MSLNLSLGTPTADSYVSVASADAYLNAKENDAWYNISQDSTSTLSATTRKENILKRATQELDRTFRYHEEKYNQGLRGQTTYQNLEFPRSSNIDVNGDLFLPDEVKEATYEQAFWILEREGKRTTEDGAALEKNIIGQEAYNRLKGWVNRQVTGSGRYGWAGSNG